VKDPGSGAFGPLDSGFGMNITDHFSEILEKVFRVTDTFKFFGVDPDPGSF
jgi:hypothetical protein